MVVAEGPNEYILYAQNDHGDLAGQFAAHWGNETFSPLRPSGPMVLAAEAHDNGWWYWDINPEVDDHGVPITFRRTPRERLYEFINKGIDNLLEKDCYAGLIASMHHAGLPQQRYGTLPAVPRRQDEYTQKFIREREVFNKNLMAKVETMNEYKGVSSSDFLWFNYRMMQVFDRLSLFFCCNFDLEKATTSESPSQDDNDFGRAFYRSTINPTPTRLGQEDIELSLTPLGKMTLRVEPFPFDVANLKVSVRGRVIPRRLYATQEEFRDVYRQQPRNTFEYTLVPK
jgi:Protein of unknown function (DUF3891)